MRRLAGSAEGNERGAVSVLTAILFVVLLGFTALAVDVGLLYAERGQLQNGADASVLAMAQKCAKDSSSTDCSTSSAIAGDLANKNALDEQSNIFSIELDKTARNVSVTTSAKETGGAADSVSLTVASVLGFPTAKVTAKSSAVWGSPRAGRAPFPLAFSICQVKDRVDGEIQLLMSHAVAKDKGNSSCINNTGKEVPGGFGYLPTVNGACAVDVNLAANAGWAPSDPGVNEPELCTAELYRWAGDLDAGREVVVFLPVFDEVRETGKTAEFHLVSFAAFKVVGWRLSGDSILPYSFRNQASTATGVTTTTQCVGGCRGVIGRFVKFVSLAEGFALGPVDPNGALIVRLTP